MKRVTAKLSKILLAGNVKGILERQWNRKKSYDEVETVKEFTNMGER